MTDRDEQDFWIALSAVRGLGPTRLARLFRHFGSTRALAGAAPSAIDRVSGVESGTGVRVRSVDLEVARRARARASRVDARPVVLPSAEYPELLRDIHDPPPVLWHRGALVPADALRVAVVGSRRASRYGLHAATEIARGLAQAGIVVVSGLAFGIDAAAHRAAIEAGGTTLAVLGSGVDRITPAGNRSLAADLLKTGCIVSEFEPGTPAAPGHFPRRNRVIAGMCSAVVIVEAATKGGALITARLAVEQGREVFAVPGPMTSATSAGTHALIRDGAARMVVHPNDIVESLVGAVEERPVSESHDPVERSIGPEPTSLDAICARSRLPTAEVLVRLTRLELDGRIRPIDANHYIRLTA